MSANKSAEVSTAQAVHTPTPWLVHPELPMFVIAECDRGLVANCDEPNNQTEARHNAAFIVRAVNSHAALSDACRFAHSLETDLLPVPDALAEFCRRNPEASCYLSHLRGGILTSARKALSAIHKAEVQP